MVGLQKEYMVWVLNGDVHINVTGFDKTRRLGRCAQ